MQHPALGAGWKPWRRLGGSAGRPVQPPGHPAGVPPLRQQLRPPSVRCQASSCSGGSSGGEEEGGAAEFNAGRAPLYDGRLPPQPPQPPRPPDRARREECRAEARAALLRALTAAAAGAVALLLAAHWPLPAGRRRALWQLQPPGAPVAMMRDAWAAPAGAASTAAAGSRQQRWADGGYSTVGSHLGAAEQAVQPPSPLLASLTAASGPSGPSSSISSAAGSSAQGLHANEALALKLTLLAQQILAAHVIIKASALGCTRSTSAKRRVACVPRK